MTKAELSDKIYEKIGLSRKEALGIVEMLFESIKSILADGQECYIYFTFVEASRY